MKGHSASTQHSQFIGAASTAALGIVLSSITFTGAFSVFFHFHYSFICLVTDPVGLQLS
jgi:hypothetical protein